MQPVIHWLACHQTTALSSHYSTPAVSWPVPKPYHQQYNVTFNAGIIATWGTNFSLNNEWFWHQITFAYINSLLNIFLNPPQCVPHILCLLSHWAPLSLGHMLINKFGFSAHLNMLDGSLPALSISSTESRSRAHQSWTIGSLQD